MDFITLSAMLLAILVLGGTSTCMAWRSASPRLLWGAATASFWIAAGSLATAAAMPARMDGDGVLHEPGLAFAALAYLATFAGVVLVAWASHRWRAARSRVGTAEVASVEANPGRRRWTDRK